MTCTVTAGIIEPAEVERWEVTSPAELRDRLHDWLREVVVDMPDEVAHRKVQEILERADVWDPTLVGWACPDGRVRLLQEEDDLPASVLAKEGERDPRGNWMYRGEEGDWTPFYVAVQVE